MHSLGQSGYWQHREGRQGRAEKMAMECILCFAVMEKLKASSSGGKVRASTWGESRILHKNGDGR